MSLATRCTACGTVFRVVQDQLKVSEGWVRCGRCDEVFNALEGLFDLEREPSQQGAGPMPVASTAPKPSHEPAAFHVDHDGHDEHGWPLTSPLDQWETTVAYPAGAERPPEVLPEASPPHKSLPDVSVEGRGFTDARWDAELLTDEPTTKLPSDDTVFAFDETEILSGSELPKAPEFLAHADRQARWQRPGVRVALSLASLLLLLGLVVQVGHHFRDTVAAQWPQTLPLLNAWCAELRCTIEQPRRIEDILVESTTLARASASNDAFKLAVNLRNRGELALKVPSVDLKLTDGSGALIARRMLSPQDFGTPPAALAPGAETTLQLLLSTGDLGVSGYTVEVFYP
jgi:predicted Zn finger-like uncharacterized protein